MIWAFVILIGTISTVFSNYLQVSLWNCITELLVTFSVRHSCIKHRIIDSYIIVSKGPRLLFSLHSDLKWSWASWQKTGRAFQGSGVPVRKLREAEMGVRMAKMILMMMMTLDSTLATWGGWSQGNVVIGEFWIHVSSVQLIPQLKKRLHKR